MNPTLAGLLAPCLVVASILPAAARTAEPEDQKLYLYMTVAVDRDCDGALDDEDSGEAAFGTTKSLLPQQCIIYRTFYRNDGDYRIRHVRVSNRVPPLMEFVPGSAEHVSTPPGLWAEPTVTPESGAASFMPEEDADGSVVWRFGGALGPGESGALQFRAKLVP